MEPSDEDIAAQRLGTDVGTWRLERLLGIGGMASVFFGRRTDGYVAAVKVLHARYAADTNIRKRFLREGPIGNALAAVGPLCEGLPQIYETALLPDGTAYLAMEVLEGENVFDRMARLTVLPPAEVLWIAQKVCEVLAIAHGYGIVHRDLKPENLQILPDARVKVLDFGVARVTEALPEFVGELPDQTTTKTGTTLGSCEYMAPEQATGNVKDVDGRTDIFGLGATMYRLLSGHTLHGDLPPARLMIAHATKAARPLESLAPSLDRELVAVVMRAVALAKNERYPDATTMRADVVALRSGKQAPYITAVAEGRVRAGDPLPRR